jgi:hypothetical protein
MDQIDITSAEFSLDIHNANKLVSETIENMSETFLLDEDYSMYMIGIIVLLLVGGVFAYTFYTKNICKRVTFQDKLEYCYWQGTPCDDGKAFDGKGYDGKACDGKGYDGKGYDDDIECNGGVCQRL